MERIGFAAFLAHEDIEVSTEWRTEIRKHLDSSSGLIAIVTEKFSKSPWANQEVGITIGKGKPVIPLIFGPSGLLAGFLEAIQGIPDPERDLATAVNEAVRVITGRSGPLEKTELYDSLMPSLAEFMNRWETYRKLPESERWVSSVYGGAHDEIQVAASKIADRLLGTYSVKCELIDFGILNQLNLIFEQLKAFSRFRTRHIGRSDCEEMDQRGTKAYESVKALLEFLKQTT